jgi:spore photoproduct lyase
MALPKRLIDIQKIYYELAVETYARGGEILARYSTAERIPVVSHWKIPALHGNEGSAEDWLRIKSECLCLESRNRSRLGPTVAALIS